eukprot:Colp12_sorted_trinity150504_noHs@31564
MSSSSGEGVWSKDIEEAFEEALAIYPPCGRRKIILSDEGKMYGRNELIARYIKMRTGKSRSRKQVSSHIQVLARNKQRELASKLKASGVDDETHKATLNGLAGLSSAQIVSATMLGPESLMPGSMGGQPEALQNLPPRGAPGYPPPPHGTPMDHGHAQYWAHPPHSYPPNMAHMARPPMVGGPMLPPHPDMALQAGMHQMAEYGKPAGLRLVLTEFSAFIEYRKEGQEEVTFHRFVELVSPNFMDPQMEHVDIKQVYDKFPGLRELYQAGPRNSFFLVKFWADLNVPTTEGFYGLSLKYRSQERCTIQCSTKVCSFGKQVVEKIQIEYPVPETSSFSYFFQRSKMCEYMVSFIDRLKRLENIDMMNSVLENFSVLQVVCNADTHETLFCTAYVFEVSSAAHGAQHHVYKLIDSP